MLRFVIFVLAIIFGISLIRSVAGILMKALVSSLAPSPPPPDRPIVPMGGELKRDPVCGTFVSTDGAVRQSVQGQDVYFCSTACRDKFRPA